MTTLPLDGLSEWSLGNYGDVPVDAGATTPVTARPHFSPEVEKYRAQAEQDLGNPADVDAYLKSLEGGNTPAPNERERQRRLRIESQKQADTQAVLATQTAPLSLAEKLQRTTTPLSAYGTIADAVTPAPLANALESVKSAVGTVANPIARAAASSYTGGPVADVATALGADNLPVVGDLLDRRRALLNQAGSAGGTAAESLVPTTLPDLALTAAPFVGKAGEAATTAASSGRALLEKRALQGLEPGASNLLEFPSGRPLISQVRYPNIAGGAEGASAARLAAAKQQYETLRAAGMTDADIAATYGQQAVDMGKGGIDTAVQTTNRTASEQIAKSAAAKRTYTRVYQEYHDALKAEGFSDAEAAKGATELANQDARVAAAQAPENLPAQKPNVLATDETTSEMAAARERARNPQQQQGQPSTEQAGAGDAMQEQQLMPGETEPYRGKSPSSSENPEGGKRRTPEENARLKAERTAGPNNPPEPQLTLQDILEADKAKFVPPADNPNAAQLALGEQGGQMGISEAGPTSGPLTSQPQTQYPKFDAASVAERQRLSAEYAARTGQPQMTEAEFKIALAQQRASLARGKSYPDNWDIDKINRFKVLEQGLTGEANPAATGIEGTVARGAEIPQTGLPGVAAIDVRQPTNFAQSVYNEVSGIAGKFLSLKSSLSPPLLRQGLPRLLTNPRQALKEFGMSVKGGVSEEAARAIDEASFRQPWISPYSKSGVSPYKGYTWDELGGARWDWGENAAERAPGYEGRGKSKILSAAGQKVDEVTGKVTKGTPLEGKIKGPGTGEGVSERQAAVQQNLNARGRYQETAQRMWDFENAHNLPHDKAMYEDLVTKIEHAQQRGGVGQTGIPLLFSARATSGRIQAALDSTVGIIRHPTMLLRPGAVQESAKNLIAFVALNYSLAQLASELGGEVTFNPLPGIRFGQHHYDLWGGMRPIATFTQDIGKVFQRAVETGDVDKGLSDALLRGKDFLRQSTSPLTNTLISAAERKDFIGKPYSLTDSIKSGELFKDMGLNFVAESLWDGFKADGAIGAAMDAPLSIFSGGVNTYSSTKDVRNDQAQQQYGKQFDKLNPEQQGIINRTEPVQKAQAENPSPYQTMKAENEAKSLDIQEARRAEQSFQSDTPLAKALPEYWNNETIARRQMSTDLENQFADMFSNFDKTKYEKAVEGYYNAGKDAKDANGNADFDAMNAARLKYVASLPADQQEWINQSVNATLDNKTPLHQSYLNYIKQKEDKGYFNPDLTAAEKTALDRANPALDVQQWYWRGNVQDTPGGKAKPGPSLNSLDAVDQALKLDPNRPVTYQGLSRPINESPKALEYWNKVSKQMDFYEQGGTPEIQKTLMQELSKDPEFKALPPDKQQQRIKTEVRDTLANIPDFEAALIWWGVREKPTSMDSVTALGNLIKQYGPLLPKKK